MADWPVKVDLSVKVSEETADKIARALLDLISPVSQSAGLLGQYVQQRRKVLSVIFEKALIRAQQSNQEIQPPPPKFLIEFADKASRDDAESELIEMWANLLAEASSDYDPALNTYIQILAEIGPDQARLLKRLAKNYVDRASSGVSWTRIAFVREELEQHIPDRTLASSEMAEPYFRNILSARLAGPTSVISVEIPTKMLDNDRVRNADENRTRRTSVSTTAPEFEHAELQLHLLERNKLIDLRHEIFRGTSWGGQHKIRATVRLAVVTPLGLDFVARCQGETK